MKFQLYLLSLRILVQIWNLFPEIGFFRLSQKFLPPISQELEKIEPRSISQMNQEGLLQAGLYLDFWKIIGLVSFGGYSRFFFHPETDFFLKISFFF